MSATASQTRRQLPQLALGAVWALLPLFLAAVASETLVIPLSDFWWHLRLGEIIWTQRQWPTVDTLSYTATGAHYPAFEWLGEVYLYLTYALGGVQMVLFVDAIIISGVALLMLLAARELGARARVSGLCTAIFLFAGVLPNRDARPQILGFLVFALWYLLLIRYRGGRATRLWIFFPTAVLWTNANGTVIIGAGMLAVASLGEALAALLGGRFGRPLPPARLRNLGVAAASVPAAMLINPWGADLFRLLHEFLSDPYVRRVISEWRPPTVDSTHGTIMLALLLASAGCLALAPRRLGLTDTLLFLAFAALMVQSERNSVWFSIVAGPIIAGQVQTIVDLLPHPVEGRERVALNYCLVSVMAILALLALPWLRLSLPLPEDRRLLIDKATPVASVEYAASHYQGERFFHPYTYGSYMLWATYGRLPVFIDGRYNHYAATGVLDDYMKICRAEDWEETLAKYGVRHVLVTKDSGEASTMKPLLKALRASPHWQPVYQDEQSAIFVGQGR